MYACESMADGSAVSRAICICHRPEIGRLTRLINADLSRRGFVAGMAASVAALGLPFSASAQPAPAQPRPIVLTNFRLFDGKSASLRDGLHLVVEGDRIKSLGSGAPAAPDGAQTINCGGRVVMPGMIDAHWHSMFAALPLQVLLQGNIGFIHIAASGEAQRTLLRGFTTVRDLGGPAFAFKQAIDQGLTPGPRIYPSGAMITGSGGHGDLRSLSDVPRSPGTPSFVEQTGAAAIVDSPDEIRLRVREQLTLGASQIKLVGGGGVSSPRSPLDLTTLTEAELRAGMEVARDWNTYATVHAYAPQTVQRAIAAGARCVEHAHLMDETTAKMMADKGVWLSIQPFLSDEDTGPLTGPNRVAALQVFAGTDNAYRLAKKYKIKTAWGSDMLFSPALAIRQGTMLTHLTKWYSNSEILTMATSTNAELLGLSGPRNPYPGKLGVIEQGAYADLLLVDGNPIENIALLANPDSSLLIVMKDGRIHKNTLKA
ncbi:amidohydrolase family protein [Variovorax sp. J22P240]|uniref:metal-dependent hydrolase family protein n=1 Tax=unclassified Variovorax TaxID=663243 RepID=UPI002574A753|nr:MULTISPECIES: amidohydrolase family protein [unclassified Variovorax]MDM0000842.1 amidohydrolase family protein [Variovorax sp. J22P240]MDM0050032.1 amidohydrolase family protein [Variovorax sp. J22R115]